MAKKPAPKSGSTFKPPPVKEDLKPIKPVQDTMLGAAPFGAGGYESGATFVKKPVPPEVRAGVGGTAIWGGYPVTYETDPRLLGIERYRTYSNIFANISIVAASVRYFLNLCGKSSWKCKPANDSDQAKKYAEACDKIFADMKTPLHHVVRRAAMHKFYGFSIQEWTAELREDGMVGIHSIEARPQLTIERWDTDENMQVVGVIQRSPQDGKQYYIPRQKLLYMKDDALNDSPEGLGIFRHLVEPATRLMRYQQLEGFGFEMNLRGVPIGRAPLNKLKTQLENGDISKEDYDKILKPIRDILLHHIRNPELSVLFDSDVYKTIDEHESPSSTPLWDFQLVKGESVGEAEVAQAIERLNFELARILGTEHLLLGSSDAGSLALSRDKSHNFGIIIDSTNAEIGAQLKQDVLTEVFRMNGWDDTLIPTPEAETAQWRDISDVTMALKNLAMAGAVIAPDDPAVNEIRALVGLSNAKVLTAADLAMLRPKQAGMVAPGEDKKLGVSPPKGGGGGGQNGGGGGFGKFSPDQPRDNDGKWSGSSGSVDDTLSAADMMLEHHLSGSSPQHDHLSTEYDRLWDGIKNGGMSKSSADQEMKRLLGKSKKLGGESAALADKASAMMRGMAKFSPDQPRDDNGEWTSGGSFADVKSAQKAVKEIGAKLTGGPRRVFNIDHLRLASSEDLAQMTAAMKHIQEHGDSNEQISASATLQSLKAESDRRGKN